MSTDTSHSEIIVSPAAAPPQRAQAPMRGHIAARAATATGAALMIISSIALIGFALYPLFTGQGVREFFISLIVPGLISLMGIVPGLLLYFTGRHTLRAGPGYGAAIIAFVLALPWLAAGLVLLPKLGVNAPAWRLLCAGLGVILLAWAVSLAFAAFARRAANIT